MLFRAETRRRRGEINQACGGLLATIDEIDSDHARSSVYPIIVSMAQPSVPSRPAFTRRFRPFLRFSLRAFLVAFTALALALGWYSNRVWRQRQIVRMIQARGGQITYDFEKASGRGPPFPQREQSPLSHWLGVDWFHQVVSVDLNGSAPATEISDEDLRQVCQLKGLRRLVLRDTTQVTPEGIKHLGRASSLEWLYLHRPAIRGTDLHPLCGLKNLSYLKLHTPIGDEGVAELSKLPSLYELEMPIDEITSDGIRLLKESKSIKMLTLLGWPPDVTHPLGDDGMGLGPPTGTAHGGRFWEFP